MGGAVGSPGSEEPERVCSQASEGMLGDAWAHGGDEGRGKLREARGSGTHAVIPRWPNGATRLGGIPVTVFERERTRGTETSQYPEEEKSTEMAVVAASEPARA